MLSFVHLNFCLQINFQEVKIPQPHTPIPPTWCFILPTVCLQIYFKRLEFPNPTTHYLPLVDTFIPKFDCRSVFKISEFPNPSIHLLPLAAPCSSESLACRSCFHKIRVCQPHSPPPPTSRATAIWYRWCQPIPTKNSKTTSYFPIYICSNVIKLVFGIQRVIFFSTLAQYCATVFPSLQALSIKREKKTYFFSSCVCLFVLHASPDPFITPMTGRHEINSVLCLHIALTKPHLMKSYVNYCISSHHLKFKMLLERQHRWMKRNLSYLMRGTWREREPALLCRGVSLHSEMTY